jgi:murein L,D-transpeptidase YcbB/YkuD
MHASSALRRRRGPVSQSGMKHVKPALGLGLALVVSVSSPSVVRAADDPVQAAIKQRIERLRTTRGLDIDGASIAAVSFLPTVYERRDYEPLWTDPATIRALTSEIATSYDDGLDPRDFHDTHLARMQQAVVSDAGAGATQRADFDLLMTDALTRLGYQLFWGKVDPESLDTNWNFGRPLLDGDPAEVLGQAVSGGDIRGLLDRLRLKHRAYQRMKELLHQYRVIETEGGWPRVPDDPALKPGAFDVVTLSKPLAVLVLYWTVAIEGDRVTWYRDVYGRDAKILAALNEPFRAITRRARRGE